MSRTAYCRGGALPVSFITMGTRVEARSFRPLPASSTFRLELTKRETEVLQMIADGLINKQIAQLLYVSPETVKSCIEVIREKLKARNRAHAAVIGVRRGLIT